MLTTTIRGIRRDSVRFDSAFVTFRFFVSVSCCCFGFGAGGHLLARTSALTNCSVRTDNGPAWLAGGWWGAWGVLGRRYFDMLAVSRPASDLLAAIVPLCFIASLVGSAAERARAAESGTKKCTTGGQCSSPFLQSGSGSGSAYECASVPVRSGSGKSIGREWRECGRRVRQRKIASAASPVALFVYFVLFLFSCLVQCVGRQCWEVKLNAKIYYY